MDRPRCIERRILPTRQVFLSLFILAAIIFPIRKRLPSSEVDTTGKTGRTAVIVLLVWARSARCIGLNEVGGVQRRRSLDRGAVLEISAQVVFMLLLLGI